MGFMTRSFKELETASIFRRSKTSATFSGQLFLMIELNHITLIRTTQRSSEKSVHMKFSSSIIAAFLLANMTAFGAAAPVTTTPHPVPSIQDTETPAQRDARMGWWREARFGMFIHWGLYAVPGGV
jgi:hypothetical protein